MLDKHAAVRPALVRMVALLLLVAAFALPYSPVSATAGGADRAPRFSVPRSATLEVIVVTGGSFIPSPIPDALVIVYDARWDNTVARGHTNEQGQVHFRLTPGTYTVAVEAEGRGSQATEAFTLAANGFYSVYVALPPIR